MYLSVVVGRYGRVILPKNLRERHGVEEGSRLIVREVKGQIVLIPVKIYEKPTEVLFSSVKVEKPIEEPKLMARTYIRRKLVEDIKE